MATYRHVETYKGKKAVGTALKWLGATESKGLTKYDDGKGIRELRTDGSYMWIIVSTYTGIIKAVELYIDENK